MRWSILFLAACGVDSHGGHGRDHGHDPATSDVADVVRVESPLLAGNQTELVLHGPLAISDDTGPYVTTHELGHGELDFVDEYTEGGLGDGVHVAPDRPGVIRLDPDWLRVDAVRAWHTDPQRATRTVTLEIANNAGTPGVTIQLLGARPVFPDDPDGQRHALLLQFTGATQAAAQDVSGITVRPITRSSAGFTIAEIPDGSASDLALVAPRLEAVDYFGSNGPPAFDPDRAVVHANEATVQALRSWQREPHTVSLAAPGTPPLTLDGAHEIAIHGHTVELAFVRASVP